MPTAIKHILTSGPNTASAWFANRSEPYRMLFPLGVISAAIGIGMWIPFYFWPSVFPYPGQNHAVLQIQGFLLCFIFGFLTTMLPKVLGVNPVNSVTFWIFPFLLTGLLVSSLFNAQLLAQLLHLLLILNFVIFVFIRFPQRKSNPPVNFIFIAVAFLVDLFGTLIKMGSLSQVLSPKTLRIGNLLQYQGFPLLLILGVGGFLLPKLFSNFQVDPKSLLFKSSKSITATLVLCIFFLISIGIEAFGIFNDSGLIAIRLAYGLRSAVWLWFVFIEIRLHKIPGKLPPYLKAARISLFVMAAGLTMPVFRPTYLLAWEHVIFLSGFLRLTLSIASRVLASHSGRMEILSMHAKKVRIYGMLIVFAMITRMATEIWPKGHWMHLAIASAFALSALFIWGKIYAPLLKVHPGRP
jgi:uncharacterized protein involved in response to NO